MKVGDCVRLSITDYVRGEAEAAMLHACNALDGTARKLHPHLARQNKARFTRTVRDAYGIVGPMALPGINLDTTRFPVDVDKPTAPGGRWPDFADLVYAIHRCAHGHGDELPAGFELWRNAAESTDVTVLSVERGKVRLSDRTIFGLLAVAVLSAVNADQQATGVYLTYGNSVLIVDEWWGRAESFADLVARDTRPSVHLDFGDWMQ